MFRTRTMTVIACIAGTITVSSVALAGPVGAAGDVYISDGYAGGLYQYDGATGDLVGQFASRGARTFMAHAWGPDGNLYAVTTASPSRWDVDKFDGTTGAWLGSVVTHPIDGLGASVGKGLAFGNGGDLFLTDWFRFEVNRYDGTTFGLEATYNAVPGDNLGTPNYMAFGPNGNLMVVSGGFNRVLEFDTSGNSVSLIGEFAQIVGGSQPQDLVFTPQGTMYVSARGTAGISEFDSATGAFIRNLVLPDPALSPIGMALDDQGRLLVAVGFGGSAYDGGVSMFDSVTGDFLGEFFSYPNGGGGLDGSPIYITIKPIPAPATVLLAPIAMLASRRRRR